MSSTQRLCATSGARLGNFLLRSEAITWLFRENFPERCRCPTGLIQEGFRRTRNKRLCFLGGLLAEGAGLVDFGGQFLNPCYHPVLLGQWGQRDLRSLKLRWMQTLDAGRLCRSFGCR